MTFKAEALKSDFSVDGCFWFLGNLLVDRITSFDRFLRCCSSIGLEATCKSCA